MGLGRRLRLGPLRLEQYRQMAPLGDGQGTPRPDHPGDPARSRPLFAAGASIREAADPARPPSHRAAVSQPAVRALALLLAGCGAPEPVTAPGPGADPLATHESAPERSEQSVPVGGVVEVQLPAMLGAGYSWQPGPLPDGI